MMLPLLVFVRSRMSLHCKYSTGAWPSQPHTPLLRRTILPQRWQTHNRNVINFCPPFWPLRPEQVGLEAELKSKLSYSCIHGGTSNDTESGRGEVGIRVRELRMIQG